MPKGRRCRGSPVAGAGTRRHEAWEAQVCIKKSGAGCHVVGGMGGLGDPGISISASECQPHACSLTLWGQPPPKDAHCLSLQVPEVLPGSREVRPNPRTFIRPGTRNPPVECQLPTAGAPAPCCHVPHFSSWMVPSYTDTGDRLGVSQSCSPHSWTYRGTILGNPKSQD